MRPLPVLLTASLVVLAACGGDDSDEEALTRDGDLEPPEFCGDVPLDEPEGADAPTSELPEPAEDDPVLDAVTVTGAFAEKPTVELDGSVSTDTWVRRVISEGDGEPFSGGLIVDHLMLINGRTGEPVEQSTYDDVPQVLDTDQETVPEPLLAGLLGAPTGSRVLVAFPVEDMFPEIDLEQGPDLIPGMDAGDTLLLVVDLLPTRASGAEVEPEPGLPTVTEGDDGIPVVEMPDADPPDELVSQAVIQGDGPEVGEGDGVLAQYVNACWEDGEEFGSSWGAAPTGLAGPERIDTVTDIPGPGLVGHSVGSRVVVVVPAELGYGEEGTAEVPPERTLVYVIDILAAGPPQDQPLLSS